jgi:competence protein ComEC
MSSFFSKYKILPPLVGFIFGILLSEWVGNEWMLITIFSPIFGALSIFKPKFAFLLFIPLGILFSAKTPLPENYISHFTGKKLDIEGVLFKSPENREKGSRLFIDTRSVFIEGKEKHVSGKVIITLEERIWGLAYGDRIRILETKLSTPRSFKNPGSFDIKRYYERQGIYATGFAPGKEWIISFGKDEHSNFFVHSVDRLRVKFGNFVRNKAPSPRSEIISAITIGDQSGVPPDLRNQFSEAGIAHLLSISGLHVGAVAIVFYVLIKWILKRSEFLLLRFQVPRLAAALTIIPILIYTAVAGFETPVVRAFIMATVYLISIVIGREENRLNTLSVSAFIILLWHPWALFELSFQLSFISVLGILFMHKFYPLRLNTLKDKILSSVKTTIAASFATLPLIINSFGVLPVISIPANLIFVPLVEFLIVPFGLLSSLAFLVSESIAALLLYINVFLVEFLLWGIDQLLKIPLSSLTVPSLSHISWILYGCAATAFILKKMYPRLKILLPVFILGFFAVSAYNILSTSDRGFFRAHFLDAGNRNVIFAQLPKEKTMLFDGGFSYYDRRGFIERSVVIPFLLESGVTKIDYLILTSLDKDHLEGIKDILRKFKIKRLWTNGARLDGELWEIIKDKNIIWKNILDEVESFEIEGVRIEFIQPRGELSIKDSSRPYPLLGKLTFGEVSFLFGESITEEKVQKELLEVYNEKIESSVVYIPRISRGNMTDFIRAVSPKIIITNAAYGNFLKLTDITKPDNTRVFRTDTQGTVTVLTDGNKIRVKTLLDEKVYCFHNNCSGNFNLSLPSIRR